MPVEEGAGLRDPGRRAFLKASAQTLALLAVGGTPVAHQANLREPGSTLPQIRTRDLRPDDLGPGLELAG